MLEPQRNGADFQIILWFGLIACVTQEFAGHVLGHRVVADGHLGRAGLKGGDQLPGCIQTAVNAGDNREEADTILERVMTDDFQFVAGSDLQGSAHHVVVSHLELAGLQSD